MCQAGLAANRNARRSESTSEGENARGNASATSNASVTGIEVGIVTKIGIWRGGGLIRPAAESACWQVSPPRNGIGRGNASGVRFTYPTRKAINIAIGINLWNARGGDRPQDLLTLLALISLV